MQITIEARGKNAENLSYYFGKHPDRPFTRSTKYGVVECKFLKYEKEHAIVYFTFQPNGLALIKESDYKNLEDYINDREFSVSSIFLSNIRNSIGYVLSGGKEGIEEKMDFTISLGPISTRLPESVIKEIFEPLGYFCDVRKIESNYDFDIDTGKVIELTLSGKVDIMSLFRQIFVLIPVIDNYRHHHIDQTEVDKILRYGEGWLENHPKKEFITTRFLGYKKFLSTDALKELETPEEKEKVANETEPETKTSLGKLRYSAFSDKIKELQVTSVVDMGAGEGRLLELFVQNENLKEIFACEPSKKGLDKMNRLLSFLERKNKVKVKPNIIQSSLFYKDSRLVNKDAIVLCEVIEHINTDRIDGVVHNLLAAYQPNYFLMSTPNYEYNEVYNLDGKFRHNDHRFEMTREEFQTFCQKHAANTQYQVEFVGIGDKHESFGHPTQLAIFSKNK